MKREENKLRIEITTPNALGIAGVIISLFSLYQSYSAASRTNEIAASSLVQTQLNSYVVAYRENYMQAFKNAGQSDPFWNPGYCALLPENKKAIQIVAGMLVMVIDSMYLSNDKRAPQWAKFLEAIPALLPEQPGFNILFYATHPSTHQAIYNARKKSESSEKCMHESTKLIILK